MISVNIFFDSHHTTNVRHLQKSVYNHLFDKANNFGKSKGMWMQSPLPTSVPVKSPSQDGVYATSLHGGFCLLIFWNYFTCCLPPFSTLRRRWSRKTVKGTEEGQWWGLRGAESPHEKGHPLSQTWARPEEGGFKLHSLHLKAPGRWLKGIPFWTYSSWGRKKGKKERRRVL